MRRYWHDTPITAPVTRHSDTHQLICKLVERSYIIYACTLYTVKRITLCIVSIVQCTVYIVQYRVYTIQWTMSIHNEHSIHSYHTNRVLYQTLEYIRIFENLQCTMYCILCTVSLYIVHYTVYSVHCIVYNVRRWYIIVDIVLYSWWVL